MKVEHEQCDNPKCNVVGVPEGPNCPPYGWILARVGWFGSGPSFDIVVHNMRCLAPATKAAYQRFLEED